MNARPGNASPNRILIVEDDHRNMRLFHDFLTVHGYEILQASDGLEAIDRARDQHPDLILMDIRLPKISGLDAARLIKQDHQTKAIPIIAVTAFATPGDETTALESGCTAYLPKPISFDKLLSTVGSFLPSSSPYSER